MENKKLLEEVVAKETKLPELQVRDVCNYCGVITEHSYKGIQHNIKGRPNLYLFNCKVCDDTKAYKIGELL